MKDGKTTTEAGPPPFKSLDEGCGCAMGRHLHLRSDGALFTCFKMEEKVGRARVPGVGEVDYAARRARWIDDHIFPEWSRRRRWEALEEQGRTARETWGISAEMEFLVCRGLGIDRQHWASPFTALRGGWGREIGSIGQNKKLNISLGLLTEAEPNTRCIPVPKPG